MIDRKSGRGRELVLVDGLSPAEVVLVHREALRVLRSGLDTAHLDAYSDAPWPPEVLPWYERALSLAREEMEHGSRSPRADPGMGIDIDVRDDEQFEVLVRLAPYTIGAEGWRGNRLVFSASDSGTALWTAVTPEQEAELLSRLDALGIPPTALAARPARGR
ncbi:MAG TPA: hypothetical protein VE546_26730 [Streptomyces sp.]|uniref:hypothetical protein n=1 Tax=Streptomyces sp. TaxID=1931 RepID=UPI002D43A137|nr:hypothetical protein [Streptomyces sp.]HZG07122.1 hypothetical protein [Streptomyces sp.]